LENTHCRVSQSACRAPTFAAASGFDCQIQTFFWENILAKEAQILPLGRLLNFFNPRLYCLSFELQKVRLRPNSDGIPADKGNFLLPGNKSSCFSSQFSSSNDK
jgi:hypothetical protein